METFWFCAIAFMLTVYVVLDGFDLGAGAILHFIARSERERRSVFDAIGPVWDGNEVWLVAAGGTLFFAFPVVYASSFSGFYLPLMMVLWLLMLRGIGIELRHHIDHEMWRSLWDFVFSGASLLLTLFLGVALANVIRGVPLDTAKQFFEPLWTDFRVGTTTGILDWYTVIAGIVAVVALSIHGAHFIAAKTTGPINQRARSLASAGWWMLVVVTGVSLVATLSVRSQIRENFQSRPWFVLFPAIVIISLGAMKYFQRTNREWPAFYSSAGYLAGMLLGGAAGLYPVLLPAISDPRAGPHDLQLTGWRIWIASGNNLVVDRDRPRQPSGDWLFRLCLWHGSGKGNGRAHREVRSRGLGVS